MTKLFVLHAVTIVGLTAVIGATQARSESAAPPDLHGMWTLNSSLSDKTPSLPNDGGRADGPGGGGRGGFGGRGAPPGGGGMPTGGGVAGASMSDPEQMKKVRAVMDDLTLERFTIVQPDSTTVTIIDGDGHTRTFSVSGKKERHQRQSATVDVQSRWEGSALRQEISTGTVQIVRTFVRDAEQNRLTVTLAPADSRRGMPPVKRVYDADDR